MGVWVGYQLGDWYTTFGGTTQRSADGPHNGPPLSPRILPSLTISLGSN